jgi:hypothetical protein
MKQKPEVKVAISVAGVERDLWRRFIGMAKSKNLLAVQALRQAITLWMQVNSQGDTP